MKRKGIAHGTRIGMLLALFLAGMVISTALPVYASENGSRSYEVIFRAGEHGKIKDGSTGEEGESVTRTFPYGSELDAGNLDILTDGEYYFDGWSPELESPVTQKAVYVAQYKRILDQVDYRINFVDENQVPVTTAQVRSTQRGAAVTARAAEIEGYELIDNMDHVTLAVEKSGTEITFHYRSTTPDNVQQEIVYEDVIVPGNVTNVTETVTNPGTGGTGGTTGTTGTAAGTGGTTAGTGDLGTTGAGNTAEQGTEEGTTTVNPEAAPQGNTPTVEIPEEDVPLAEGKDLEKESPAAEAASPGFWKEKGWMVAAGAAAAAAILGLGSYILIKRRRK